MMANISKDQVRQILEGRPSGTTPQSIMKGLIERGHNIEGFNSKPATPEQQQITQQRTGRNVDQIQNEIMQQRGLPEDQARMEAEQSVRNIGAQGKPGKMGRVASSLRERGESIVPTAIGTLKGIAEGVQGFGQSIGEAGAISIIQPELQKSFDAAEQAQIDALKAFRQTPNERTRRQLQIATEAMRDAATQFQGTTSEEVTEKTPAQIIGEAFSVPAALVPGSVAAIGGVMGALSPEVRSVVESETGENAIASITQFANENPNAAVILAGLVEAAGGGTLRRAGETATQIAKQAPEAASALGSAALTGAAATVRAAEGFEPALRQALTPKRIETFKDIPQATVDEFRKATGFRMTGKKTKTPADIARQNDQIKNAVLTITENKQNLKYNTPDGDIVEGELPSSLLDTAQALQDTKRKIFDEYNALTKQATGSGVLIKIDDIADDLDIIANTRTTDPAVRSYAQTQADRIRAELQDLTPQEAEQIIKDYNENLVNFYTSGSAKKSAKIDAEIASKMRDKLDNAITSSTDKEYQELKNRYASLKSVEGDVARQMAKQMRKSNAGFFDIISGFSVPEIIFGLASGSPAAVARGTAAEVVKNVMKSLNDPDRIIKNMFQQVDRRVNPSLSPGVDAAIGTRGFIDPKAIADDLGKTKAGAAESALLQEAKKYKSADEFVTAKAVKAHLAEDGTKINKDGTVTLYHATTPENAKKINQEGFFKPSKAPVGGMTGPDIEKASFFGTDKKWTKDTWGSGRDSVVEVNVPAEYIRKGAQNKLEVYFENGLRRDGKKWVPVTPPRSTFYNKVAEETLINKSKLTDIWRQANKK